MTDYWNDPPEVPEVPECCDAEMEILVDGTCVCVVCKHRIEPQPDPEPMPEPVLEECVPVAVACPHGNIGPCSKCDYLADLAYDSAREQRLR